MGVTGGTDIPRLPAFQFYTVLILPRLILTALTLYHLFGYFLSLVSVRGKSFDVPEKDITIINLYFVIDFNYYIEL